MLQNAVCPFYPGHRSITSYGPGIQIRFMPGKIGGVFREDVKVSLGDAVHDLPSCFRLRQILYGLQILP